MPLKEVNYIHSEINGDPCNIIGSQQCDFYELHYFFLIIICLK